MEWKPKKFLEINNRLVMSSIYPEAQIIKDSFSFLETLGFKIIRSESLNYGSYVEFKGNGMKIYLGFDFKSYAFSFDLYKKEDLKYSDEAYGKDIVPFFSLDSSYNCDELQPNKKDGYEKALKKNVEILKGYLEIK